MNGRGTYRLDYRPKVGIPVKSITARTLVQPDFPTCNKSARHRSGCIHHLAVRMDERRRPHHLKNLTQLGSRIRTCVQSGRAGAGYTHPLWMALLTLMGAVSGSWIVGTLITSVILAGIALGILVFRSRNLWQLVTTASFVLLSNTLVNWGTSGLEGPLAIALLSGLFVLQSRDGEVRHPLLSGFVLSLLLLCRMDYLLLLAPWLLWATKQTWIHPVRTIRLWTGLTLPLAAWALISWQYYGFILPSTFEAKPASLTRNSWAAVWTTYGSVSVSIPPYWSFWSACRFSGLPIENAL